MPSCNVGGSCPELPSTWAVVSKYKGCLCRALEGRFSAPGCSLDAFAHAFRAVCDAAILHAMGSGLHTAQAVSLVLDYGNQRITALERSSGASTSATAPSDPGQPEDPFWAASLGDLSAMLSLQV